MRCCQAVHTRLIEYESLEGLLQVGCKKGFRGKKIEARYIVSRANVVRSASKQAQSRGAKAATASSIKVSSEQKKLVVIFRVKLRNGRRVCSYGRKRQGRRVLISFARHALDRILTARTYTKFQRESRVTGVVLSATPGLHSLTKRSLQSALPTLLIYLFVYIDSDLVLYFSPLEISTTFTRTSV